MKKISALLIFVFLISGMLTSCGLQVPRPEIKEGRFNYSVTYEINGAVETLSGVYVCEYNGTSWSVDGGYHRSWKGSYEGDVKDDVKIIGTTYDGGKIELSLGFYPHYFMGESIDVDLEAPEAHLVVSFVNGEEVLIESQADVIEEKYGARIISYEYDDPIKNSFGLFK